MTDIRIGKAVKSDGSGVVLRSDLASSFVVFGSYFPAWTACLLIGCAVTLMAHLGLRGAGMLAAVPLLPVFYLLLLLLGSTASWLVLFASG